MQIQKNYPRYELKFILILTILYFLLPIFLNYFFPKNFYIFSDYQFQSTTLSLIALGIMYIFYILIFKSMKSMKSISKVVTISKISKKILFYVFLLFVLLLFLLIINGLYYRIVLGISDRIYLLTEEQKYFVSGMSFVLIGGLTYSVLFLRKKVLFILIFSLILIDILYMGKKFSFYAIAILFFILDKYKMNPKYFYFIVLLGVFLIIITFITRAYVSVNDFQISTLFVSAYGLVSEFMGVYASIGWAQEYGEFIHHYFNLDRELSSYYLSSVGHGLAIHPIAYFFIIASQYWYFIFILYFMVVFILMRFFSIILGNLSVFVLLINSIDFFRHGPDIFMKHFFIQSVFLAFIISLPRIIKRKASENIN